MTLVSHAALDVFSAMESAYLGMEGLQQISSRPLTKMATRCCLVKDHVAG